MFSKVYPREKYISKIRPFVSSDIIKVITGIRRCGKSYILSIGKIGKFECDFIVRDHNQNYAYIQVAYTLRGEDAKATERIKEREYRPFRDIKDG